MNMTAERFNRLLEKLNTGAELMDERKTESDKLQGAQLISEVGAELVKDGGKPLLEEAHSKAIEKNRRTIELQWFGLTDSGGRQWLP